MRLALIPPLVHVNAIAHTDYQLALPQLMSDVKYVNAYRAARLRGDYIILDNGAAEGEDWNLEACIMQAALIGAQEIVLPDVIGDGQKTASLIQEQMKLIDTRAFSYMGVVQGSTMAQCHEMIDWYMNLKFVSCIGIPRHLLYTLTTGSDMSNRFHLARYINQRAFARGIHKQIHLLGTSPDHVFELEGYGTAFNTMGVRGIDTSLPFSATLADTLLAKGGKIGRPDAYFNQRIPRENSGLSLANIATMEKWTRGGKGFYS